VALGPVATPGRGQLRGARLNWDGRSLAAIAPAEGWPASRPVESIARVIPVETVVSSEGRGWRGVEASRFRYATAGFYLPGFAGHAVVLHLGPTAELVEREEGRLHRALVRRGDISVVPAGLESEWWWEDGKEVDRVHAYLDPGVFRMAATEAGAEPEGLEVLNSVAVRDPVLERTAVALLDELEGGGPAGGLYAESLAQVLAVRLLRNHSSLGKRSSRRLDPERAGRLSGATLGSVFDYVDDKLSGDLSLSGMAAAANLSPYHFARSFKRTMGITPHQYALRRRIERAKEMLLETDLPVGDVARRAGFVSPSHFSQQFKRAVGVPPSALR
jgi:AraC family transcriptional regulator